MNFDSSKATSPDFIPVVVLTNYEPELHTYQLNSCLNGGPCVQEFWRTTEAAAFDIPKDFDRVWHAGLLCKLKFYGIAGQIFGLISSFFSTRWHGVIVDDKSSQEYPVNPGVFQSSVLGPALFLLYINDLPDVICNLVNYADGTTLYSKCDQAPDLWQQLELASEVESDLQDTNGVGSGLLISMQAKLNCFHLTDLIKHWCY